MESSSEPPLGDAGDSPILSFSRHAFSFSSKLLTYDTNPPNLLPPPTFFLISASLFSHMDISRSINSTALPLPLSHSCLSISTSYLIPWENSISRAAASGWCVKGSRTATESMNDRRASATRSVESRPTPDLVRRDDAAASLWDQYDAFSISAKQGRQ